MFSLHWLSCKLMNRVISFKCITTFPSDHPVVRRDMKPPRVATAVTGAWCGTASRVLTNHFCLCLVDVDGWGCVRDLSFCYCSPSADLDVRRDTKESGTQSPRAITSVLRHVRYQLGVLPLHGQFDCLCRFLHILQLHKEWVFAFLLSLLALISSHSENDHLLDCNTFD